MRIDACSARHHLIAVLIVLTVLIGFAPVASARDERAGANAPLVGLLTPHDGTTLNAATLRVAAIVAAFKPHPKKSFVFNGEVVAGKNAGEISHVELAVDGAVIDRVEAGGCRRQMLADFRVDLTRLTAGPHTLTVTAYQGHHRAGLGRSVSSSFTLDPTLAPAEINRVEEAATPKPFACLAVHGEDDDDDEDDRDARRPARLHLEGQLVLGQQSDGIDLTRDRVVIALGPHVTVLEPSMLRCKTKGRDGQKCAFKDASQPLVQNVELERKRDGRWTFELKGGPLPPGGERLYLRIGNDGGGIDLATGELLAGLRPVLDTAHQAQMQIGPDGGTIEKRDAGEVLIRLFVPPGALTRVTEIVMTPLQASPMPDASTALHPGVKFEPEGLQFAKPAVLTLDFSATGQAVTDDHFIFLLTSPLSMVPLFGHPDSGARTITASVHHFSEVQGGEGDPAYSDPAAWVNEALASPSNLSLSELQSVLAAVALAQQLGQDGGIDPAQLQQKTTDSIAALTNESCQSSPTDQALDRLLQLEALAQQLGVETAAIRSCMEQVLRALIERDGNRALLDPSDANLQRLLNLAALAQQLGFTALETVALQQIDIAMRELSRRVLAQVDAARGTDQEGVVTEEAKDQLQAAIDFVTTTGAAVLTVAPALDDDLQRALDGLGEAMKGIVRTAGAGPTAVQAAVQGGCFERQLLGADSPLPFSMTALACGATTAWTVAKAGPNVIRFDVEVTGPQIHAVATAALELTFSRAGVLTLDVNPAWGPAFTGGWFAYFEQGEVVVFCAASGCDGSHSATVAISEAGKRSLFLAVNGRGSGSSRVVTVTFTPSP